MTGNQIHRIEPAEIDITAMNKEDLIDVRGFTFDTSIPMERRMAHLLQILKSPYCFRFGDIGVKLEFADNARSLQDAIGDLLVRKKGGCYGEEKSRE